MHFQLTIEKFYSNSIIQYLLKIKLTIICVFSLLFYYLCNGSDGVNRTSGVPNIRSLLGGG